MTSDPQVNTQMNAEVLLWQGRIRLAVAIFAGGAAFILQRAGVLRGDGFWLLGLVVAYMAVVSVLGWGIRRAGTVADWVVAATVLCDLLFIILSTVASSRPEDYNRMLILSFFVLHLTESYFGRAQATFAAIASVAGYLGATGMAMRNGASLQWAEALWSVGLFSIVAVVFIRQYSRFQRRLEHIIELFEGAEEGDFTKEYDLNADQKPDAITQVGRAYNRVRGHLSSMILTDPLTGCLNRRGLDQALSREIARSSRANADLSFLAVDLDHFKQINDTYGHLAGDIVLREFGAVILQTARVVDIVARTGGEEFSVLLPDTDPAGAFRAAVRLCDAVRAHAFMMNGKRVPITISVGVASKNGTVADTTGAILKERADEALYAAKRDGRDRAIAWHGELAELLLASPGENPAGEP